MKTPFTILTIFLISFSTFAQQGINYKALIKDDLGNIITNQDIEVRFFILITNGGALEYYEDHVTTTDANGIVVLTIGEGTPGQSQDFNTLEWSEEEYELRVGVDIEQDGSFVYFDDTPFNAVPYAKHAETAANVFSGDYNDLTNQPTTLPTGLERITESTDTDTGEPIYGWRLIGVNPANYGNIGENAIDLSYQPTSSSPGGATGIESVAIGYDNLASGDYSLTFGARTEATKIGATAIGANTTASGEYSNAMGHFTVASGDLSTAMGYFTTASGENSTAMGSHISAFSFKETAIGSYNTYYTPISRTSWNGNDKLFVIGNGSSSSNRNNALTVLKNGKTGINTSDPQSLFEVAHENGGPTPSNLTNAISIKNSNSDKSWQFHVNNLGALVLYRNGIYTSYFHETSGAYVTVSDRRLKNDITPLDNGTLNKVMQLNPVSYLMKDQKDTKRNLGLISQEVQELFPSITHYVEAQDILSLSYTELIPILIKALQEQQAIIEQQNAQIETLSTDNSLLKEKDDTQDKSIEALVARLNLIESKSSH